MFEKLQGSQGKKIVLELVNGRIITGTVLEVSQECIRLQTEDGIGNIATSAVHVVWEKLSRSVTEEDMDHLAEQLGESMKAQIACTGAQFNCSQSYICRPPDICTGFFSCPGSYVPFQGGSQCPVAFACPGTQFFGIVGPMEGGMPFTGQTGQEDVKAQISCTAFPGFTCAQRYICRPPDFCSFNFNYPGNYAPGFPQGGGVCPTFFCGSFQFQQPCGPFQFQQPCGTVRFQCGSFQFQQPCGPFQFQQPCGPVRFQCGPFQFQQPCAFPFGSQCTTPGGFICPGQQFAGVVGPTSPVTTPGTAPGTSAIPPLPPTELAVKQGEQGKENK